MMSESLQTRAASTLVRTHESGKLRESDVGTRVVLSGWVQRRRDLGGVIFVDLRDRSGIVQIVFSEAFGAEALEVANQLRSEYVIAVVGDVVLRAEDTVNEKIATGRIEVRIEQIEIINRSKTPPFLIEDGIDVDEPVRLRYRYLDLRRPEMRDTIMMRHRAMKFTRDFLDQHGFVEVETPMLTKSTPEGARDYLVPSRIKPGEFYALPQSPQLFKQLLMVSGFERYFQIVRCFRDEDLRADRQPEFTQIDIEMSFMSPGTFQAMMEEFVVTLLDNMVGVRLEQPIQRLTYAEAMARYGSDKPDVRFGLELVDLSDVLRDAEFKVFRSALDKGGQVKAVNAKGCASYSRREIDLLGEYAARYGAKGMAWITMSEEGPKSPILKFFTEDQLQAVFTACDAEVGDLLLFAADQPSVVADVLGNLRLKLGRDLGLIDETSFRLLWVTEFPLVEYDPEEKRYVALHHPFTMPMWEDLPYLESDPVKVRAQAYDLVLNGYEVGGGSMRIFQRDVQEAMFRVLGLSDEEAREKFGFLLDAFEYGTPAHGGIAFGLDRLMMIMAGRSSLRECIAFPKTASGTCLMTEAPSSVSPRQLADLHIATIQKPVVKS